MKDRRALTRAISRLRKKGRLTGADAAVLQDTVNADMPKAWFLLPATYLRP